MVWRLFVSLQRTDQVNPLYIDVNGQFYSMEYHYEPILDTNTNKFGIDTQFLWILVDSKEIERLVSEYPDSMDMIEIQSTNEGGNFFVGIMLIGKWKGPLPVQWSPVKVESNEYMVSNLVIVDSTTGQLFRSDPDGLNLLQTQFPPKVTPTP